MATPTNLNHETYLYELVEAILNSPPFDYTVYTGAGGKPNLNNLQKDEAAAIRMKPRGILLYDITRHNFVIPVEVTLWFKTNRNVKTRLSSEEQMGRVILALTDTANVPTGQYHRGKVEASENEERNADNNDIEIIREFNYYCVADWEG